MLLSLGLIFLVGMSLGYIFKRLKLPSLVGMILTGIILGPFVLDLIDSSILNISAELRRISLVIILTRAGLALDINELKKNGRPAILMCFVPAAFEIVGSVILAPVFFGISRLEGAVLGCVIAAVSPAVTVPRMLKIINEGYGERNAVPQIILAGASADDVFVIVLFTSFTAILSGGSVSASDYIQIPTSILFGIIIGAIVGFLLSLFFKRVHIRDSVKVLILLSISFLLLAAEDYSENGIRISGLIAIMAAGTAVYKFYPVLAKRLSAKYNKLWVAAEIILFVLVGAAVDIKNAAAFGITAVAFLLCLLAFRMAGVFVALIGTKLTKRERIFCMLAYTPKATVQAAIGAIPLAMGLECGQLVLTVSVLAILITAPLGALAIDLTYKKLLCK